MTKKYPDDVGPDCSRGVDGSSAVVVKEQSGSRTKLTADGQKDNATKCFHPHPYTQPPYHEVNLSASSSHSFHDILIHVPPAYLNIPGFGPVSQKKKRIDAMATRIKKQRETAEETTMAWLA